VTAAVHTLLYYNFHLVGVFVSGWYGLLWRALHYMVHMVWYGLACMAFYTILYYEIERLGLLRCGVRCCGDF